MALNLDFEHRKDPLLPINEFARRQLGFAGLSLVIVVISLFIGICGYHFLDHLNWIDSFLNASMIMGGMGPVGELHTDAAKVFASFYALYCGAVLLIAIGIFMAPLAHRILHRFHVESDSEKD